MPRSERVEESRGPSVWDLPPQTLEARGEIVRAPIPSQVGELAIQKTVSEIPKPPVPHQVNEA